MQITQHGRCLDALLELQTCNRTQVGVASCQELQCNAAPFQVQQFTRTNQGCILNNEGSCLTVHSKPIALKFSPCIVNDTNQHFSFDTNGYFASLKVHAPGSTGLCVAARAVTSQPATTSEPAVLQIWAKRQPNRSVLLGAMTDLLNTCIALLQY